MTSTARNLRWLALIAAAVLVIAPVGAAEIGQIKTSKCASRPPTF
jgi:hypothetical protein